MAKKLKTKTKKKQTKTSSPLWVRRFFAGLMVAGVLVWGVSLYRQISYARTMRLEQTVVERLTVEAVEVKVIPVRLTIAGLVDVGIEVAPFEDQQWVVAGDRANYLEPSAGIGEAGNMIIYGHNKKSVLGNIRQLISGEEMVITGSDGQEYKYQVVSVQEVKPDQVELLAQSPEHELTMYTCTGAWDSKRFVVKARLIE